MTISERAQQLLAARTPFVHATVVRAQPPTSAYPGDEAILLADGTIEGFVGGQCAQNSVRKAALGVLQAGESVLLRVLPDGDVHFPEAPGACVVVNPCLSGGSLEIFLTPQLPAPLIRIYGTTPIADALAQLCGLLGYDVRRADDLADTTAVVIASHGGPEAETIRAALDHGVGYIGLVASKVRGAAILDSLDLSQGGGGAGAPPGRTAHRRQDPRRDRGRDRGRTHRRDPRRRPGARDCPGGRPGGGGGSGVRHDGDDRARRRAPAAGRRGLLVLRSGMSRRVREPASRRMNAPPVTGVVLAAGGSRRLGTPKQLLPYRDTTLLGATLDVARGAGFDQLIVTLGGAAQAVRDAVPLDGVDVVAVEDFGIGCSASLRAALERVDPRAAGIVLMLGDQDGVEARTLKRMIEQGPSTDIMVCRYDDGIGHPFWLSRGPS